jgi:four helix bundle protein
MRKKMTKQIYDLEERLLEYSVRIIKIVEQLPNTRAGNHVAGQLLKSGTSPYPNHGEAQAAESPKDFIHKLRISLKELRETQRWLKLIQRVPLIKKPELLKDILEETEELIKIFVTSIKTAFRQAVRRAHGPEQSRRTHGPERSRRAENKQK